MTSIIKFTALSGGQSDDKVDVHGVGHCYILELDSFTFMLDCGWDVHFESKHLINAINVSWT